HNLTLVNRLRSFLDFNLPLLVGLSRKSTIGQIVDDRLTGSLAGGLAALERGARIIRVHDVAETVAAVRVWRSIQAERVIHE
ncbi:MAG: dihydropteroate synthase, partial [Pseudomonadales bacterium]|nr:dihydropteroate synthase [Pseudomonadales bacterium]